MYTGLYSFIRSHARAGAAFVLGMSIGLAAYGAWQLRAAEWTSSWPEAGEYVPLLPASGDVLAESEPVSITIPAIELTATFEEPLGITENGEIEVPESFDTVGWYKYGPTPGEQGPAVIVGHVDSFEGPEIFYDLRDLVAGDRIEIEREDGSIAIFEVTELEQVSQDAFPTERVYGDLDHAGLRLITCSGTYDRGERRYSHNLIVYARLVGEGSDRS